MLFPTPPHNKMYLMNWECSIRSLTFINKNWAQIIANILQSSKILWFSSIFSKRVGHYKIRIIGFPDKKCISWQGTKYSITSLTLISTNWANKINQILQSSKNKRFSCIFSKRVGHYIIKIIGFPEKIYWMKREKMFN